MRWLDGITDSSHHRHEFEQAPGVGDGQGGLACRFMGSKRVRHDLVTEQQKHTAAKCLKLGTRI